MRAVEYLREITESLSGCGIDDAGRESEIFLSECAGIDRLSLYRDNAEVQIDNAVRFEGFIERRRRREPLQYIIGHTGFYGLKIKVGQGVLIPRPETELVVEEAVKAVRGKAFPCYRLNILDLCTGSGCIALALARQFPESCVYGTDISINALGYAEENAKINGIGNVRFLRGSLFGPVQGIKFDLVVANPPYIKKSDLKNLQPEIREWEPAEALDGGDDGVEFYRLILSESPAHLTDSASVILEAGFGEAEDIIKAGGKSGMNIVSIIKDYNGIDRVLKFGMAGVSCA